MSTTLQFIIAAALVIACVRADASAVRREIAFDDGTAGATTVIGLFRDQGQSYHQRMDFTLSDVSAMSSTRVRLHAHVGSQIEPAPGQRIPRLGVRVNSGPWHWRDLSSYKDDSNQWIEFPVPTSEWRVGVNTVETNSTVGNWGNMTSKSVDILGSRHAPIAPRSRHTHDFKTYKFLSDRNWGIRLSYVEAGVKVGKPVTLAISPTKAGIAIDEPLQLTVEARDAEGRMTDVSKVEWSASHGMVDRYGMLLADVDRPIVVTAKLGALRAQSEYAVSLRVPDGVAPPRSRERLIPNVASSDLDLCGKWQFRRDTGNVGEGEQWFADATVERWGSIDVPGSWQASGWGMDYHGVAWYRREFAVPKKWAGKQIWLRFDGVATSAKVWVNGKLVGEHTGDWAPFELRATDSLRCCGLNTIAVRVQEMPGHFSVGFPCAIAPHFGGIWQAVSMRASAGMHFDDVAALASFARKDVLVETAVSGSDGAGKVVCVVTDPDGKEVARSETDVTAAAWGSAVTAKMTIPIADPQAWSAEHPRLYSARVEVIQDGGVSDSRTVRFGMRDVTRQGARLLLNGKPLYVRGALHWGYYPQLFSIDPSEEQIRKEFSDLRAAGFNCVKVCMFMFPKRFYEIADETGMLIWQEYPIWQTFPKSDDNDPHEAMVAEYTEWFKFDRSHASVVLRDLTCEAVDTNPTLMGRIYGIGKSLTRDQLIEDNSAYMNQIHTDWYDQHIYAELNTLHDHLPALAGALRDKPEVKPYLTGEDFDADTYRDTAAIRRATTGQSPWWLEEPTFAVQESTEQEFARHYSPSMPSEFVRRQNLHSLALRKGLIEEFRKFPELSGYVMTQIRDNMLTRPGFYDDLGKPKWKPEQWRGFTADRVLIASSERQSFCFRCDETPNVRLLLSNFGDALDRSPLHWRLMDGSKAVASGEAIVSAAAGTVTEVAVCKLACPSSILKPTTLKLVVELGDGVSLASNEWPVWFFPKVEAAPNSVLVTATMDAAARKALAEGARVVFIPEDADTSLPRRDAQFWREMAIWLPTGHHALGDFPHEDFVDRQFYDLTQRKPFDTATYRAEITPLVWGVNARFSGLMLVDYVFEARVGKGSLLACCLRVRGKDNVAGQYLLDQLVRYAASAAFKPAGAGDGELGKALK